MAGEVYFNNGINVSSGGNELLDGLITEMVDELDIQTTYEETKAVIGFIEKPVRNIDEKFSSKAGVVELPEINENSNKPEAERTKLPNKGYEIHEYAEKLTTSFLLYQWLKKTNRLDGASESVEREIDQLVDGSRDLLESYSLRRNIEMTRILTEGFGISALNGPGSATPKGQALFSSAHTARQGNLQFGNVDPSGFHQPLSAASLQVALDVLKNDIRLESGHKVKKPKFFKLIVSREMEVLARKILNDPGNGGQPLRQYAGGYGSQTQDTNANQANQFYFRGNLVEIEVLDLLGDYDRYNNLIGRDTYWYVSNPRVLNELDAFKMLKLYDPYIGNRENKDTNAFIIDIRCGFGVDHYYAELGLFGSKGDGSAV